VNTIGDGAADVGEVDQEGVVEVGDRSALFAEL
jgi:hypothetical protein